MRSLKLALVSLILPLSYCFTPLRGVSLKYSLPKKVILTTSTRTCTQNTHLYSKMPSENKTQRNESDAFPSLSILGVCGSIGSGKSFACSLLTSKINTLTELSAHHIDTDSLAHGVYAPGSKAIEEIGKEFGEHVIANGTVDRKALGAIVFGDRAEMEKLEKIVWPHVKTLLLQKIKEIQESAEKDENRGIVVVEAAVLLDADWDSNELFDAIWIVRASLDTSCERLVEKRGLDPLEALKRLEAQQNRRGIGNWKEEMEEGTVTAIIENEGSDLWDKMKECMLSPGSWKDNRCPPQLRFLGQD